MLRLYFASLLVVLSASSAFFQKLTVLSSNQKVKVDLVNGHDPGEWHMIVSYLHNGRISSSVDVSLLRRGGFAASLTPIR
jgi:hypothetical protein